MVIDLKKKATRNWLRNLGVCVVLLLIISLVYGFNEPENIKAGIEVTKGELFGIPNSYYTLISLALLVLYFVYRAILNPYYIYYCDDGDHIDIKYFSFGPFDRKPKAFRIPKKTLYTFEMKKSFFGLKTGLIIKQKVKEGIATYPMVYITSISKSDKEKMKAALKRFSIKK